MCSVEPSPWVQSSRFLEGLGEFILIHFWQMNLGLEGFEVWFFKIWAWVWPKSGQICLKFRLLEGFKWVCSSVLSEFEVQPVKFEAVVRSSLYLGSIQHYYKTIAIIKSIIKINFMSYEIALVGCISIYKCC